VRPSCIAKSSDDLVTRPSVDLHTDVIAEARAAFRHNLSAANGFMAALDSSILEIHESPER
jgi:hypothetical protein